VFATGLDDAWAAFRLAASSYAWLSDGAKQQRLARLVTGLGSVEADMQILRVARAWPCERYAHEAIGGRSDPPPHARAYVEHHLRRLSSLQPTVPAVYLLVSLRPPRRDLGSHLSSAAVRSPRSWWQAARAAAAAAGRRRFPRLEDLERSHLRADAVRARLAASLPVRPVRGVELQWLVRRAFCRGVGEPLVDQLHEPRALVLERAGEALLAPLEGDVLRWMNGCVEQRARTLRVESELGTSWQANLVLGALPETVDFPGPRAELMFAPVESAGFPLDLSLNVRHLPNDVALRLTRRRIQDADQILRAEAEAEQGASDVAQVRTQEARDLLAYLQGSRRPPLLRASLAIAVGAESERQLEQRVESCRRAYGEIALHRPLGEQLELFLQHLPGQRTRVAGYEDTLTVEQVAAMMPLATHAAGSEGGFYLGHTLTASRRPVRFTLREGSDADRNSTILSVGALGAGKTTLAQKLEYEAFLQGARVIICDPKGDHRVHLLDEVAPHAEVVTLRPDRRLRGLLDPLRVAPAHLRQDAAVSFLRSLLPPAAAPHCDTALLRAVDRVITRPRVATCCEVVRVLLAGDPDERDVGEALEIYARSGLTQLGFADAGVSLPPLGSRQVTYLPIRDLPSPQPGVSRAEHSHAERVGEQLVRLIAMFAMSLMARERDRLKVFSFDEGWRLLGDPVGRGLLASLQRMGRSELAVPIIGTQLLTDALIGQRESLENLIGATFVFGMRSETEAGRALALLRLDPEDERLRRQLLELSAGRCLFRDHRGRVEAIQVEVVVPALLRAFSTTPRRG
jgi:hypothetical protein